MPEVQIKDIKKVNFKKGDFLIVKSPSILSDNEYARMKQYCEKVLPKGVGLLILDNGKDVVVLEKEVK